MLGDDSALSEEKGSKPYLGQAKSSFMDEYLVSRFPVQFLDSRAATETIDGENLIFIRPSRKSMSYQDHIVELFKSHILWRMNSSNVVMVFDQPGFKDDPGQILKGPTRKKTI